MKSLKQSLERHRQEAGGAHNTTLKLQRSVQLSGWKLVSLKEDRRP